MPLSHKKHHGDTQRRLAARQEEFLMAAAHQLKSPVAIMQWCLQSVLEVGQIDTKSRTYVVQSLQQANAMGQLIADLLNMVRITGRAQRGEAAQFERVDMNMLIDGVFEQYQLFAHQRSVHLVRGSIERLPAIYAEEAYLRQALVNLVDNAIKYSNEGGTVTVSAAQTKEGLVEVSVQDQGIGISEAEQSRLFSEFFRGEGAKAHTREGTGLGLVLVKHIVEAFGGKILLESRINKGSKFTIQLPTS